MRFIQMLKPAMLLVMMMAIMPMLMPAGASAEVTTIRAEAGTCAQNVDSYSVQLQSGVTMESVPVEDFPQSVTLHFADGTTASASSWLREGAATQTYRLDDSSSVYREIPLLYATAQFDASKYVNHRFGVTAYPCDETPNPEPVTYSVSGNVIQQGNMEPVADLTVCLDEADLCTTTDANGSFTFTDVEDGTYTLTTNGSNWKAQSNSVTVTGGDVVVNVVQEKGGGL